MIEQRTNEELAERIALSIFGAHGDEVIVYQPGDPGFRIKTEDLTRAHIRTLIEIELDQHSRQPLVPTTIDALATT